MSGDVRNIVSTCIVFAELVCEDMVKGVAELLYTLVGLSVVRRHGMAQSAINKLLSIITSLGTENIYLNINSKRNLVYLYL